jgi:polysaccharide chain length determinant protein (PEP-CTERM system associated)
MQPQDSGAVSRRPLDVEDYIDVVRRHKAWILGPLFAGLVISVVVAFLWPDTYISTSVIRVVPPQIPENFVPTNINTDIQGRVNSMTQVILSRATLTNIINAHGLYPKERSRMPLDDVIENMRLRDIRIGPVQQSLNQTQGKPQFPAFQIGFAYSNRMIANQVTTDLVARFLEENQRETSLQTTSTTQFLQDSWTAAKQKLDAIELRLSGFRSRNLGRLPEEQQSNYQQLNAAQVQMLNLNTSMSRVNQEKLVLENQLRIYKDQYASMKDPNSLEQVSQQKNEKLAEKDREVSRLETYLANLREHYRDTYPDVQNAISMLATAKKQREEVLKEEANKKPESASTRPVSPQFVKESRDLEAAIKRIQGSIEAKDLEMQDLQSQVKSLTANVKNLQNRLEGFPVGIKDYDELIRDRDLAKREYEDLDKRLSTSEMSTKVNNRQQGERLEQLDPPSMPITPALPNRPIIVAVGTGLGLALGLFLAGAREVKDTSLKNLKDVRAYTQLPVLGSIPLLENDLVVRRRRRLGWLAWSTACLVGVVIMSSSVVYYYATKQ